MGSVWRGYRGQGLVFAGYISTKRGHVRAGGDVMEERARPTENVLTGWFRHRAEKFLSTSVIPLRLRTALRSAVDQRVGQTNWATSSPGVTYTSGRDSVINLQSENYMVHRDKTQRSRLRAGLMRSSVSLSSWVVLWLGWYFLGGGWLRGIATLWLYCTVFPVSS